MSARSASSWCLAILVVTTLFAGASSAGSAGTSDKLYTASINPTTAPAGTTAGFTFRLTNSAASSQLLGSANVTIPAGFAIVSLGPAVAPAGKKWTVTSLSGVLGLRTGAAKDKLGPGEFVDVPMTLTAPCTTGSSTWTTAVKQSNDFNGTGNDFANAGNDPSITVTSGPLGSFTFAAIATPQTAGAAFGVSVTARDVCGNVKADYGGGATLTGNLGTAPNGTLPSYGSLMFASGVGSGTVTAYKAESGKTLTVTHGAVGQTSGAFTVSPAAPDHLVFTQQPTRTAVSQPITPAPAVEVRDQYDNVAVQASGTVSVAFGNNPSGTTLGGMLSATPSAGVATFADLTVGASEVGYTLVATSTDVAGSKESAPFDVVDTLVNCPSSGCKASAKNATTFVEINVPSKPGTSSDPLAISLSGAALPFTCDGVTALSVGSLTTIDPPPGYTAQNPITATWKFDKSVAPGTGVANFVFCKNSGPGTPFHVVLDCPSKKGPLPIPCITKRSRDGVGDLIFVVLMTSGDPVGGTR